MRENPTRQPASSVLGWVGFNWYLLPILFLTIRHVEAFNDSAPLSIEYMLNRNLHIAPNLLALLNAASFVAELVVPPERRAGLFLSQGDIFSSSLDETSFYAQAAKHHGVQLIGEMVSMQVTLP